MHNTLFVRRPVVQVALIILLLAVVAVVLTRAQDHTQAAPYPVTYNTLRVYGGPGWPELPWGNMGAGSSIVTDEHTGLLAETQPYTESLSVFNPQLPQAPRKDSITWNPLWMSNLQTFDENWAKGLYGKIEASGLDASEKVWFRMWYEPEHWDKDLNASGNLDRDADGQPVAPMNPTSTSIDEWYPAIMQEFTYMLMELGPIANKPEPMAGQAGTVSFVFPVGMRYEDLFDPYGYGLTSLDANFDGTPDIVHVESELTLFNQTDIAADFDGDGLIDPLDTDGIQLSGDELAVLRLDTVTVPVTPTSSYIQFLDHLVRLDSVYDYGVVVEIYYTGDLIPKSLGKQPLGIGDMALAGIGGPQLIEAIDNGGSGTNMCNFPTGPFFVYLESVDTAERTARLMLGRALGATYSGMEDSPGLPDRRPGDPWFLKRFYVDGHEYNVVAIKTEGSGPNDYPHDCDLDDGYQEGPPPGSVGIAGDGIIDVTPGGDTTDFKFITIRTPIPKVPVLIEQHSVNLQDYALEDWLSVMPPYNYEHYIIEDVQAITAFDASEDTVDYLGKLVGPVPPILQKNGPFPYDGATPGDAQGLYRPYDDEREMYLTYIEEDNNPQFLGELKEKYGEITATTVITEFWYVEQWWTRPWEYTEFVLPDIRDDITEAPSAWDPNGAEPDPDLYLLTSAFTAPQAEYLYWIQDVAEPLRYNLFWDGLKWEHVATNTITSELPGWRSRVKLWFDPAKGDKTYKNEEGLRIFGMDLAVATGPFDDFYTGPGNTTVTDTVNPDYPVEIPPYTDPWAPFNPQLPEAPRKDSLTLNPAYMNEFRQPHDDLYDLYRQITIEEHDAREKVFPRMWYEPEYLDKVRYGKVYTPTNWITVTQVYTFPAVMQEFTYMFLDTQDEPSHGQPKTSRLAFPIGTGVNELPAPVGGSIPPGPSFGYGLTTFDANFDGNHDIVTIHSEETISETMGIGVDFDGNGSIDQLDIDGVELTGDELVIFTVENITLGRDDSAMFLDHMITLDNVTASGAEFDIWYTGGGLHTPSYSLHPDHEGTASLGLKEMALVYKSNIRKRSQGQNTLGWPGGSWGPWFVYLKTTNTGQETAVVTIGRALGATHSAIDNGVGGHDLLPGDPWWLKRFFVDGHEYNVVAIKTVPADVVNPGDEGFEFKYITIRTPVPKVNFVNDQDSQKLEGYNLGMVYGEDTSIISVMPPFNFHHTRREDIQSLEEWEFADSDYYVGDCMGVVESNVDPLLIRIVDEDRDEQFFGELKEKYWEYGGEELWSTEQFHTLPDKYTDLELPAGQLYLLTSDWESDQSWAHYYGCDSINDTQDELSGLHPAIPGPNSDTLVPSLEPFFIASVTDTLRVKFWYDPEDSKDIYKNTGYIGPTPTPTVTSTPTDTPTPTSTPTSTSTRTPTPTNTSTPTNTPTNTPTSTPTDTPTITSTPTNTPTSTNTPTPTDTPTITSTPTNTSTSTNTPTPTNTPTNTPTSTPTNTSTNTPTPTPTPTRTSTSTPTVTPTPTETPEFYERYLPLIAKYPTPTPTSTPTPTRTPTPTNTPKPPTPTPSCEEKICNGGFEWCGCWTIPNTPRQAAYSAVMFRTGSWSMRLGITSDSDAYSWSSIRQQVTIPGGAASATLSFWYYPICQDSLPYDWQEVIIYDATVTTKLAYAMSPVCSNSQTWTHRTFNLMPYKGQTITLYFNVYNDGVGNLKTAMYLDDVSVQVCY
jgi:hypothetical protein